MLNIVIFVYLIVTALSQSCLKGTGESVQWWVIMKVPPKIGKTGYGYYDSTMKTGKFVYSDSKVDITTTHLTKTVDLINTQNL
jgi:prophage antirepressor-like protein